ncbi:MAG: hypothetical protein WC364_06315 [Eubacteriales bacterium]
MENRGVHALRSLQDALRLKEAIKLAKKAVVIDGTKEWHLSGYNKYLKSDEIFNQQYHNVFRSIVKIFENNWILEHNEFLSSKEIESIRMIVKNHTETYTEAMNSISW